MPNGCATENFVHNGKDSFRLTLTDEQHSATNMRCEYRVIDEDNEVTRATG